MNLNYTFSGLELPPFEDSDDEVFPGKGFRLLPLVTQAPPSKDLCQNYFISQYRRRVQGLLHGGVSPYPLLDGVGDEILPYLLNDNLLFVTQKTNFGTFSPSCFGNLDQETTKNHSPSPELNTLFDRLWEAFRIYPEEWTQILKFVCFDGPFKVPFTSWLASYDFESLDYDQFVEAFDSSNNIYGIDWVLKLIHQRLQDLKQDLSLADLESIWNTSGTLISPFTIGLQEYVHERKDDLISKSLGASLLYLLPSLPVSKCAPVDNLLSFGNARSSILFSTAGTGKTRRLLDLLENRFGMYIVAPGVPGRSLEPQDAASDNPTLLRAFRGNASEDTFSLQNALDTAPFSITEFDVRELGESIVFARLIVFDAFLELSPVFKEAQPEACQTWKQLQINCSSGCDPFDLAWRLARLDLVTYRDYAQRWESGYDYNLVWCIDEVQEVLETGIGKEFLESIWYRVNSLLNCKNSKMILSGTALRLEDMRRVIKNFDERELDEEAHAQDSSWFTYSMITNVQIIEDFKLFWDMYRQHIQGILGETKEIQKLDQRSQLYTGRALRARAGRPLELNLDLSDLSNLAALDLLLHIEDYQDKSQLAIHDNHLVDIRTAIINHCPKFFGRHRWSALFIEQILKQAVTSIQLWGTIEHLSVEKAAEDAAQTVENALRTQLIRIKDKSWAEDLYWMAIRADVFSQSSVIEDETAQLVSEGFTLVEKLHSANDATGDDSGRKLRSNRNRIVRASLCEPLAVHAIMSYLREERQYDRLMNRFFSFLQIDNADQGSIGKIAEYILAAKFHNLLLRKSNDDIISTNHRESLWNVLSNAQRVDTVMTSGWTNPHSTQGPWCNDYYLYNVGNEEKYADLVDKELTIPQWIEKTGKSEPRSNFLFPSKMEGPDLMFFLNNGPDIKLCAVQFKTGAKEHQPSKLIPGLGTLTKWLGSCQFLGDIILIYVATSTTIDPGNFVSGIRHQDQSNQALVNMHDRIYVCYLDRMDSVLVWGETFHSLITLMKGLDD